MLAYTGNEPLGKKHFTQALQMDPDLREAQLIIKLLKKSAQKKEEAAEVFKSGNYSKALEMHRECLNLDLLNGNYNAVILLNISICQDKLGDKREALYSLNKAVKYNPRYAKALIKRGDMHLALEEFNEAIRDYSEASEHDSTAYNVTAKLKDAQAKAKKAKRKDYYKIMGVSKEA